ncbi:hypothetical protein PL321_18790 [Caloramator sp. mosi_1]|uniref:hypothetical protein n=1 Tax=Caloramator sp. mosi_1 TaxID=3023090 RepID=UPI00236271EA|nr:hypothetical protein [Caloramator sp. mosi_1]WDC84240.1 hypothetical protein PL321_18790 [Caloramator sp. mosi_1]
MIKRSPKRYNLDDEIEYVRYRYYKFLKGLKRMRIDILSSDTSLDVNKKAEGIKNNLDKIRDVYINARYNNAKIKKELVDDVFKLKK